MKRTRAYVGIDIGKRTCVACTMGADGGVLARMDGVESRADSHMAYIAEYAKAKTAAEVGAACLRMADRTMKAVRFILGDAAKLQ